MRWSLNSNQKCPNWENTVKSVYFWRLGPKAGTQKFDQTQGKEELHSTSSNIVLDPWNDSEAKKNEENNGCHESETLQKCKFLLDHLLVTLERLPGVLKQNMHCLGFKIYAYFDPIKVHIVP